MKEVNKYNIENKEITKERIKKILEPIDIKNLILQYLSMEDFPVEQKDLSIVSHLNGIKKYEPKFTENLIEKSKELEKIILNGALDKWRLMENFLIENLIREVDIFYKYPLDLAYEGATARVYESTLDQKNIIAAKIFKKNDIFFIIGAIQEGLNLKLTGEAGVTPKFYGFHINEKQEFCILMEKVKAYDLSPSEGHLNGTVFINNNTVICFKEKMRKLHQLGFTFSNDSGQILIAENGEPHIIDIDLLTPLNSDGTLNESYGLLNKNTRKIKPTESIWFKKKLQSISNKRLKT